MPTPTNNNNSSLAPIEFPQGYIQLSLAVSRVNIVQHQVVTELEMKQSELWKKKSQRFKNVDTTIENVLYQSKRPLIALVLPSSSLALSDFDVAKRTASTHFDFREYRVTFSKGMELATMLKQLDGGGFTAIALVRGGGSGLEALDDLKVLEAVTNLNTPFISAIGHEDEKIFIKRIADKVVISPTDLGNYFREVIERVDPGILITDEMTAQDIEMLREERRNRGIPKSQTIHPNWSQASISSNVVFSPSPPPFKDIPPSDTKDDLPF